MLKNAYYGNGYKDKMVGLLLDTRSTMDEFIDVELKVWCRDMGDWG